MILIRFTNNRLKISNYLEILEEESWQTQHKNNFNSLSTVCYHESFSKDTFGIFRNTEGTEDSDIYCAIFYTEAGSYEKRRDIL